MFSSSNGVACGARLWVYLVVALLLIILPITLLATGESRTQYLEKHLLRIISKPDLNVDDRLDAILRLAKNDDEKAWLVYQWITRHFRHDSRLAARIGDPDRHSLDALYRQGGGSCAVYANVVHRLLTRAGFEVKTVYGTVKADAGSTRRGLSVNHVWNAVKIGGHWRVIDATWGSGYVGSQGFQRDQNDLFFLMPPELAVLSHFDHSDELGFQKRFGVSASLFARMPEDAVYAAAIGFEPAEILHFQRQHAGQPLVKTFDHPASVFRVLKAPVQGRLSMQPQSFKLETAQFEELIVVQGKTWQAMKKDGVLHALTIRPERGELIVMGRRPKQDDYEALLAYSVK
jgi:hypothetical protein